MSDATQVGLFALGGAALGVASTVLVEFLRRRSDAEGRRQARQFARADAQRNVLFEVGTAMTRVADATVEVLQAMSREGQFDDRGAEGERFKKAAWQLLEWNARVADAQLRGLISDVFKAAFVEVEESGNGDRIGEVFIKANARLSEVLQSLD